MKKLLGLILVSIAIAVLMAVAMGPEMDRREKQRREQEEKNKAAKAAKEERDEAWRKNLKAYGDKRAEEAKEPKEAGFDQGFQLGFTAGKLTRSRTNISPPSAKIETLAMQQIDKQKVPVESQSGFIRGFKAGWSSGWRSR